MDSRERRYGIYVAIIVVTLVMTAARIASVSARDGKTPFLSANDRSRWTAVIALVDHHTPTIDHFQSMRHWQTIDKVRHIGPDGELHYYSSKPPLLAYLMACKYWCFQRVTGLQFERNPFIVGRSMLALVNLPLLAIYGVCIVFLVERWGRSDWGRIFCVAAAMWGTFLTPFAVTLNNHLPAAVAVVGTLDSLDRLWQHTRYPRLFAWLAGLGATLTASFELPALSFLAAVTAWMVWQRERFHVGYFLAGVALVAAAFFATNYASHQSLRPPYAHRNPPNDDWYDYPGSYWRYGDRQGTDAGEASIPVYAFHMLVGHHGIFSLTPLWLLCPWGAYLVLRHRRFDVHAFEVAAAVAITSLCIAFYLVRPEGDRNYGGVTCGFRWLFWCIPLWLVLLVPAVDRVASRSAWRFVLLVLLMISIFSATFGGANPWVHPWPYQFVRSQGWL